MASCTMPSCQMKAANTDRMLSATDGLMASLMGPLPGTNRASSCLFCSAFSMVTSTLCLLTAVSLLWFCCSTTVMPTDEVVLLLELVVAASLGKAGSELAMDVRLLASAEAAPLSKLSIDCSCGCCCG